VSAPARGLQSLFRRAANVNKQKKKKVTYKDGADPRDYR
jgi:hypothetical protein